MGNLVVKAIETNAVDRLYEISKILQDSDILLVSSFDRFNSMHRPVKQIFIDIYEKLTKGENYEADWLELKNRFDKTLKIANVNFNLKPYYLEIENSFKYLDKNYIISRADFLTAVVISKIFNLKFVDASELIKYNNLYLNYNKSGSLIKKLISKNICIPSNYGVNQKGDIILNSNNVNASLISTSLNAKKLEIYTSNDAIGITNKNSLRRCENLSYNCAKTAYKKGGQQHISPQCLNSLQKQNIPIFVKNIFLPVNQTIISKRKCEKDISCIAGSHYLDNYFMSKITLITDGELNSIKNKVLRILESENITPIEINTRGNYIDLIIPYEHFDRLMTVLEIYAIKNEYRY